MNKDKSLTTFDTLFFFACVGLPFSLGMCLYGGDFDKFDLALKSQEVPEILMGMVLASGFLGLSTTISTLLVSNLCGPFALIFAGTLGHMFCTVAGFWFFNDAKATS